MNIALICAFILTCVKWLTASGAPQKYSGGGGGDRYVGWLSGGAPWRRRDALSADGGGIRRLTAVKPAR